MTEARSRRLLVVANRTESAPQLLDEVGDRSRAGCQIALMVPPERHPEALDWTPEAALRLVRRAAGDRPVTFVDCGEDAAANWGAGGTRRMRRDPAFHSARAPRALAPPHSSQAHPGHWHSGDRHPARPFGLVLLPRLPGGMDTGRGRPAHVSCGARRAWTDRGLAPRCRSLPSSLAAPAFRANACSGASTSQDQRCPFRLKETAQRLSDL